MCFHRSGNTETRKHEVVDRSRKHRNTETRTVLCFTVKQSTPSRFFVRDRESGGSRSITSHATQVLVLWALPEVPGFTFGMSKKRWKQIASLTTETNAHVSHGCMSLTGASLSQLRTSLTATYVSHSCVRPSQLHRASVTAVRSLAAGPCVFDLSVSERPSNPEGAGRQEKIKIENGGEGGPPQTSAPSA